MRNYLVVANQTLGGEHLLDTLRQRVAQGPCRFHLVVPATRLREHWSHTEGQARVAAQQRLNDALARLSVLGVDVDGEVGVEHPLDAIANALDKGTFDEIILSTLPPGPSQWLRQDLPHRVARAFELPVTHIIAARRQATRDAGQAGDHPVAS